MTNGGQKRDLRAFRRPRLYEQLADHLTEFIEAQGLVPGDKLPPERELAAALGVSRATLSQALVALEVRGRVDVRHGDGVVVQGTPDEDGHAIRSLQAGLVRAAARRARTTDLPAWSRQPVQLWAQICALASEPGTVRLLEQLDAPIPQLTRDQWARLTELLENGDEGAARDVLWPSG